MMSEGSEFKWGDQVVVKSGLPGWARPGEAAAVVAITDIQPSSKPRPFPAQIGSRVYLIEFADGTAVEVPSDYIEAIAR